MGQLTVGSNPTPSAETARTLPGVDRVQLDELMSVALDEARAAAEHGDVPIGAAVARVDTGATRPYSSLARTRHPCGTREGPLRAASFRT